MKTNYRRPNSASHPVTENLPFPRSYWVKPGEFLAGISPEAPSEKITSEQVRKLLESGIRTIVDLMQSGEASQSGGFIHRGYQHIWLTEARHLSAEVSIHRFPIRDVSVSTVEHMKAILDVIDTSLAVGKPVYVHCRGGIGRTGLVVGCFLQRHGLSDADTVLDRIAELRCQDPTASIVSPETNEQREFVKSWKETAPVIAEESGIREGTMVRDFKIRSLIGVGGMGRTYLASNDLLAAPVAIKVVSRFEAEGDWAEAQLAARVQGQHIVPVFDAGVASGEAFLIQPYVDGIDLRELLVQCDKADLVLPDGLVLDLFRQACLGLREIHAAGVIHRDVKPPNMFLRGDGSVVVGDFGIAASNRQRVDDFGTPGFQAPEIRNGGSADIRSDLYALGSTLDHLLQNQLPSTNEPLRQGLRAIAKRLQAELPRDRYQNTKELLAALDQFSVTKLKLREFGSSEVEMGPLRLRVRVGDLTTNRADVIVSAANVWMAMDQGVAKALKDRGGAAIEAEARAHGKVAMGDVIWTYPGKLPAQHVAHAVSALDGAICLQRCTLRSLLGAEIRKANSIAFPALGTGVARVPMRLAARRIMDAIQLFAEMRPNHVKKVDLVLADEKAHRIWIEALEDMKEAE